MEDLDPRIIASAGKMLESNYQLKEDEERRGDAIYCKQCGDVKKRLTISNLFHAPTWRSVDRIGCTCEKERIRKKIEEETLANRLKIYDSKDVRALIGETFLETTFETLPENPRFEYRKALAACLRFCENIDSVRQKGQGLYLYSHTPGNGKTTLMACMRNRLVYNGIRVVMVSVSELLKQATARGRDGSISEAFGYSLFMNAEVLLIDDIGVQDLSLKNGNNEWLNRELYALLDHRWKNKLPTAFTSNYSPEELQTKRGVDFKTVDRIVALSSMIIKIEGESFRGKE